jgi:hypothetical protein
MCVFIRDPEQFYKLLLWGEPHQIMYYGTAYKELKSLK